MKNLSNLNTISKNLITSTAVLSVGGELLWQMTPWHIKLRIKFIRWFHNKFCKEEDEEE